MCPCTHPVCVVDNDGVRVAVVGWVCIGVIAEPSQHGSNLGHVPHHVPRDVTGPLGECFQVHRLDDLVCGSLNPRERGQVGWGPGRLPTQSLWGNRKGWRDLALSQLCPHQLGDYGRVIWPHLTSVQ